MNTQVKELIKSTYTQNKNLSSIMASKTFENIDETTIKRAESEFSGAGPLESLLEQDEVSEVLVNSFDRIFYEKAGQLFASQDHFYSAHTYLNYIERLAQRCGRPLNRERPFLEAQLDGFRYSLVYSELTNHLPLLSIRRTRKDSLSFENLTTAQWCPEDVRKKIEGFVIQQKNILVVGSTSSGKTTLLQALLGLVGTFERCVIIEDTKELNTPNEISVTLLARESKSDQILPVSIEELVKRSLRLRPDRIVVGEVRGSEAYSLLLALSSGHKGGMCTLHATTAKQALLRLEMLVQLGAPQWDLRSIRRLMALSLDYVLVVEKTSAGRKLKELCEIKSVEESGIILEKIF